MIKDWKLIVFLAMAEVTTVAFVLITYTSLRVILHRRSVWHNPILLVLYFSICVDILLCAVLYYIKAFGSNEMWDVLSFPEGFLCVLKHYTFISRTLDLMLSLGLSPKAKSVAKALCWICFALDRTWSSYCAFQKDMQSHQAEFFGLGLLQSTILLLIYVFFSALAYRQRNICLV